MSSSKGGKLIEAAGTVTLRPRPGKQPQVLVVHRPAYDDWSLPKGKLETDEYLASAARRETLEETGADVRLGPPVPSITYRVGGGTKTVHYWQGIVIGTTKRAGDAEVDKIAWLTPKAALERLTYADEREVLRAGLAIPETTPFLVVRHAQAMQRRHWSGRDQARPLTNRGRKQSRALVPLLASYGVESLASSSSTRCVQTLQPYEKDSGLDTVKWSTLSEEQGCDQPKAVKLLMQRLVAEATGSGVPTAVCGHRPVLPAMLEAIGIPPRPMKVAAVAVAHLGADGKPVAIEWHKPRI